MVNPSNNSSKLVKVYLFLPLPDAQRIL